MEITLDLSHIIHGTEESEVLRNVLEAENDGELQNTLNGICLAAASEYLEMILGKQVPTRAKEIMERRLFHLLKHHFVGRLPNEAEVSSIFQLTESESRSLIRNVRTRFKFDLNEELNSTIRTILLSAEQREGKYRVVIQSDNILEELRHTVSVNAGHLDQISKVKNSAGLHNIPEDTFELLCNTYGISLSEIEAASSNE